MQSRKIDQFVLVPSRQYLFVQTKNEFGKISARLILVCIEKVLISGQGSRWTFADGIQNGLTIDPSKFSRYKICLIFPRPQQLRKLNRASMFTATFFFNEDGKIKFPPIVIHLSFSYRNYKNWLEFQRLNTRFNFIQYIFKLFSILRSDSK